MPFIAPLVRPDIFQGRIVTRDDGLFELARNRTSPGEWADLAMVHDDIGQHWDCVAWLHDHPETWWLSAANRIRNGNSAPIIGAAEIMFASDMGADVLLVETPARYVELAWCGRWPGPTACVLDWGRHDAVALWLSRVRAVLCETDAVGCAAKWMLRATPAWRRFRIRFETPVVRREVA